MDVGSNFVLKTIGNVFNVKAMIMYQAFVKPSRAGIVLETIDTFVAYLLKKINYEITFYDDGHYLPAAW